MISRAVRQGLNGDMGDICGAWQAPGGPGGFWVAEGPPGRVLGCIAVWTGQAPPMLSPGHDEKPKAGGKSSSNPYAALWEKLLESDDDKRPVGSLWRLATATAARRLGVASRLLKVAESFAATKASESGAMRGERGGGATLSMFARSFIFSGGSQCRPLPFFLRAGLLQNGDHAGPHVSTCFLPLGSLTFAHCLPVLLAPCTSCSKHLASSV